MGRQGPAFSPLVCRGVVCGQEVNSLPVALAGRRLAPRALMWGGWCHPGQGGGEDKRDVERRHCVNTALRLKTPFPECRSVLCDPLAIKVSGGARPYSPPGGRTPTPVVPEARMSGRGVSLPRPGSSPRESVHGGAGSRDGSG